MSETTNQQISNNLVDDSWNSEGILREISSLRISINKWNCLQKFLELEASIHRNRTKRFRETIIDILSKINKSKRRILCYAWTSNCTVWVHLFQVVSATLKDLATITYKVFTLGTISNRWILNSNVNSDAFTQL